jgi:hypothetical protein
MKNYLLLLLFLLLLSSCGVFQPRDTFEIPESNVSVDRFNFSAILKAAGKKLTWKNYETFFCDTLQFSNLNSGVYGKKSLIEHLEQIELQYPRFSITWANITSYEEDNVKTIAKVTYTIMYDSTSDSGGTCIGKSTMGIVRDGDYKIATWDDFPEGEQKSFFAPLD